MTSIMGHTTVFLFIRVDSLEFSLLNIVHHIYLFSATRANRGSSQPSVHSQWASRKVMTSPLTSLAPIKRARISPDRL